MELNQTNSHMVYRAYDLSNGRYQGFWDGYDYQTDFNKEQDLIIVVEEHNGPDWSSNIQIHKIHIIERRVK